MTHCTKNIDKDYFDKTFFIENNNNNLHVYNKTDLTIIDNLDISNDNNLLGQGSFNTVKEFPLSEKCLEKDQVAVRIRKLLKGSDYYINGEGTGFKLENVILKSIDNIIDLSSKNLHPKVYEIKVIQDNKHRDVLYLIIVMEKYKSDLHTFLKNHKDIFKNNIHDEIYFKDEEIWKTKSTIHNEIIIQLLVKTIELVEKISNNGYFCYDIKPRNLVVNYNIEKQTIDIKIIDVDADYCIKDMLVYNNETSNDGKTFTKLLYNRCQIYKNVMLSLLAQHLYEYNDFNYLSNYFVVWNKITNVNNLKNIYSQFKDILHTIDSYDDYKDELSELIEHYFQLNIEDYFVYNLLYLNRDFKKKAKMGFGLRNLIIVGNKVTKKFDFKSKLNDIIRKQKQVEAIEDLSNEMKVPIKPSDELEPPEPKKTPVKKNKNMEYKEEKEEKETNKPQLNTVFNNVAPLVAESKGGKKKTRKSKKSKKMTKKGKNKVKQKTRKQSKK
jgi:hypothetical protein